MPGRAYRKKRRAQEERTSSWIAIPEPAPVNGSWKPHASSLPQRAFIRRPWPNWRLLRRSVSARFIGIFLARTTSSRSEEHTSELQSLMRISYAVFCLNKKNKQKHTDTND